MGDNHNLNKLKYKNVYPTLSINLIRNEFRRLQGQCYLDHAGTTLYSELQLSEIFEDLQKNYYGNPHANNTPSNLTEDIIDQTRHEILQYLNTNSEEYSVVFTSGATAALKLVAESFFYSRENEQNGTFGYLEDNHTSVLGMREYANDIKCISSSEAFDLFNSEYKNSQYEKDCHSLFVYPAQSNYSGYKYPLSWISLIQQGILNNYVPLNKKGRWFCMLDATAFVPCNQLNLTLYKPDFVCFSFHKMFGYPTGLGALLIKTSSANVLQKRYFGGGSVSMVLSRDKIHVSRNIINERFEDGTLPFLSIISIRHGFSTLKRLQLSTNLISQHTFNLAKYVYQSLLHLHHSNGKPVAVLYHESQFENSNIQGGIVNFNLLKHTEEYVGYAEVKHIANLFGIHLRTGCSCNPGACQRHLKLSSDEVRRHFELGHICGDENDLVEGNPTGSVRISFGYMSRKEDADIFLKMIVDCFVHKPVINKLPENCTEQKNYYNFPSEDKNQTNYLNNQTAIPYNEEKLGLLNRSSFNNNDTNFNDENVTNGTLEQVFIYPIKSCGFYKVEEKWELVSTGLKYDREWMIINASGVGITQKREPRLCLLRPKLNIQEGTMDLEFEGKGFKSLPLNVPYVVRKRASKCLSKVCGDKIEGWDCGNEIANWLDEIFETEGLRLVKQCTEDEYSNARTSKDSSKSTISLSNQAQFLLINSESVNYLLDKLSQENFSESPQDFIARFRPNLVVNLKEPFLENKLREVRIGNLKFKFAGQCNRCQMICVDQFTSKKSHEPLQVLSKNLDGKLQFGIYLSQNEQNSGNLLKLTDPVLSVY